MATYKVGQRVRKVRLLKKADETYHFTQVPVGTEGVIRGRDDDGLWLVEYVGYKPRPAYQAHFKAFSYQLEPLTDPGFDAFMERVMQPIKEPVSA